MDTNRHEFEHLNGRHKFAWVDTNSFRENPFNPFLHCSYYNDETLLAGGKNLECGDLSPLLLLWRLVAKAGPRPAARESWTPSRIRRRQVACRKRGQVRALQSSCGSAAPGNPWSDCFGQVCPGAWASKHVSSLRRAELVEAPRVVKGGRVGELVKATAHAHGLAERLPYIAVGADIRIEVVDPALDVGTPGRDRRQGDGDDATLYLKGVGILAHNHSGIHEG